MGLRGLLDSTSRPCYMSPLLYAPYVHATGCVPMQSDGVGALFGGPNSPLVFDDKSNPSTTTVGITNVELSNSTFRCLNEPELNLLAETLAAVEEARGGSGGYRPRRSDGGRCTQHCGRSLPLLL